MLNRRYIKGKESTNLVSRLWLEKVVAPITCQEFSYEMNELSSDAMDEILDLIYGGQKIMAIKRYTEMRDVCLVESMQLVVQLTNRLRVESPGKFEATSKSGSAGVFITLAMAVFSTMAAVLLLTAGR